MLIFLANLFLGMRLKNKEKRNRRLLAVFSFLRKRNRKGRAFSHKKIEERQDALNSEIDENKYINDSGYIEHQWEMKDLLYGKYPMSYNGCEIIACYNALNYIKRRIKRQILMPKLKELIGSYYSDGVTLSGKFGTDPAAVRDYFVKNNYKVRFSEKLREFEEIAGESDVSVITIFNDRDDVGKMVHTLCVTKENGKYTAHNAPGISGMTSAGTMDELIRRCGFYGEKGSGVCISGIRI